MPEGTVVPAVEAATWSGRNVDIRPRLFDKASGQFRLVDSGSMITATVKRPEDKLDESINLVAVNGRFKGELCLFSKVILVGLTLNKHF